MERLKKSKQHRAAFVASQINIGIPFQIRALRKQRNWDQKKLASEADMLQPRISAMESPGYGNLTIETLKRLASAFDIALIVRFAPFSELLRWSDKFSPDDFQVSGFEKELEQVESSTSNILTFNYLSTNSVVESSKQTHSSESFKFASEKQGEPSIPIVESRETFALVA